MKKLITISFLSVLVIIMVLMSGCTSSNTQSAAPVYAPAKTAAPDTSIPKEIVVSNGDYTTHGLKFQFALAEQGNKITYIDHSGNSGFLLAQDNKKLLKFSGTVTSLDGDQSFYALLQAIDDEGNTYNPICPIDDYQNCKNQDNLGGLHDPVSGQKVSGIVIFSVPKTVSHVNIVYNKFVTEDNPQVLRFSFNL
jgi:hypothetical protein